MSWAPDPRIGVEKDVYHFNSIWFDDDKMYLLAHNWGPSDVWMYRMPGRKFEGKVNLPAEKSHNILRVEDQLVTTDSWNARMAVGKEYRQLGQSGKIFPRGVAYTGKEWVVGISAFVAQKYRDKTEFGQVRAYDLDWNQTAIVDLQQGMVCEVRVLDVPDLAHHGQVWKGKYGMEG